jgi:hypothetical protein
LQWGKWSHLDILVMRYFGRSWRGSAKPRSALGLVFRFGSTIFLFFIQNHTSLPSKNLDSQTFLEHSVDHGMRHVLSWEIYRFFWFLWRLWQLVSCETVPAPILLLLGDPSWLFLLLILILVLLVIFLSHSSSSSSSFSSLAASHLMLSRGGHTTSPTSIWLMNSLLFSDSWTQSSLII